MSSLIKYSSMLQTLTIRKREKRKFILKIGRGTGGLQKFEVTRPVAGKIIKSIYRILLKIYFQPYSYMNFSFCSRSPSNLKRSHVKHKKYDKEKHFHSKKKHHHRSKDKSSYDKKNHKDRHRSRRSKYSDEDTEYSDSADSYSSNTDISKRV